MEEWLSAASKKEFNFGFVETEGSDVLKIIPSIILWDKTMSLRRISVFGIWRRETEFPVKIKDIASKIEKIGDIRI